MRGRKDFHGSFAFLLHGGALFSILATQRLPRSWNSSKPLVVDHHSRALKRDMVAAAEQWFPPPRSK